MGKTGKRLLAFFLAVFGLGGAFTAGAVIDEYLDLGIGDTITSAWHRLIDKDADAVTEKTGSLTDAACEIAKAKGEDFYLATEARFAGQMTRKSKVTYTPLYLQTTNDGKINFTYKSSVALEDKTLEDLITATLNVNSNAENDGLLAELVTALKKGDEAKANEIITTLSQNSNITISYAVAAENDNAAISGAIASKVSAESLSGLDDETKAAIAAKIAAKDYVVTGFELKPDGSNKGQVISNIEDVADENDVITTYCDLTAKNVSANVTLRVSVGDKLYAITVKQSDLKFDLGKQPWNANGISVEELAKLINGLSAEELEAAITANSADPTISYTGVDLGTKIKLGKQIVVSINYNTTDIEEVGEEDLVVEAPAQIESEEEQQIEAQVATDAQKAAMQVAAKQAAARERVNYNKGQQYNRTATNRNMTQAPRR